MNLQRDYYQGTEFDMTEGVLAGPFGSPNMEMPGLPRSISIARTSYTAIVAPQKELSKVWIAMDQPSTSVFVPFYSAALREDGGNGTFHHSFGSPYGPAQQEFNRTTAWWAFDFVSNWMNLNYRNMSMEEVFPARDALQEYVFDRVDILEKNLSENKVDNSIKMAQVQTSIQAHVTKTWWELADTLIVRYNDGFFNFGKYFPNKVMNLPFPTEWLRMVGYQDNFYKPREHWFMPAGEVAKELAKTGVLAQGEPHLTTTAEAVVAESGSSIWTLVLTAFLAFAAGSVYEKKSRKSANDQSSYYKL